MARFRKILFNITSFSSLIFLISACSTPDQRLTEDEQSCQSMGHKIGTPNFKSCLEDLNVRRCPTIREKNGELHHVPTVECTRRP